MTQEEITGKLLWPFGAADKLTPADAATIEITPKNRMTVVEMPALSQNTTVDVALEGDEKVGDILIISADQGGTGYNIILGNNLVGQNLTGVSNDKDTLTFVFDGTAFRQISNVKNEDAA